MATSKEFLDYVLGQLAGLEGVRSRAMMGEYLLYCREKLIGGLYDNQLMLKPTSAVRAMLPDAPELPPYSGAKPMIAVVNLEDRPLLEALAETTYAALPAPKAKRK